MDNIIQNLMQWWYINNVAWIIPVIVGFIVVWIYYDAGQNVGLDIKKWLALGLLSLALTLPAAWLTYNLQDNESGKKLLKDYLQSRQDSPKEQYFIDGLEEFAQKKEVTEINFDYKNIEYFLYFSLIGAIGSLVVLGIYYRARQAQGMGMAGTQNMPYPQTMGATGATGAPPPYPMTDPGMASPNFSTVSQGQPTASPGMSGQFMNAPGVATFQSPNPQAPYPSGNPATEQFYHGMPGGGLPGQGQAMSSASPPTELLNVAPITVGAWLVMKSGPRAGKMYQLQPQATVLGRDGSSDIILDDTTISRQHIKIRQSKDANGKDLFTVHDLATSNGTQVNGVNEVKKDLKDGDEIKLGNTILVFKQV